LLRGCIPKNLMHVLARTEGWYDGDNSAEKLEALKWDIRKFTQQTSEKQHTSLKVFEVHHHTRVTVLDVDESYVHLRLHYASPHSVQIEEWDVYAEQVVIASGSSPWIPNGLEQSLKSKSFSPPVTSDDFFWDESGVGKKSAVLIYGGGYIAMETAGLLKELRPELRVIVGYRGGGKSSILKGWDPELVEVVRRSLQGLGVEFVENLPPDHVGEYLAKEQIAPDMVDVIVAAGRHGNAASMGEELPKLVKVNADGRIPVCGAQQAVRPETGLNSEPLCHERILVAGDIVAGGIELATVAKKQGILAGTNAGRNAASGRFGFNALQWSNDPFPTAIYTPIEMFKWSAKDAPDISTLSRWSAPLTFSGSAAPYQSLSLAAPSEEETLVCGQAPSAMIIVQAASWDAPVQALSLTHSIASELGQALMFALERGITPGQIASVLKAFPQDCRASNKQALHLFEPEQYVWGNPSGSHFTGVRIKPPYLNYAMESRILMESFKKTLKLTKRKPTFWNATYWSSDAGEEQRQQYPPQRLNGLKLVAPNARVIGNALEVFLNNYGGSVRLDEANQHTQATLRKWKIPRHPNGGYFALPEVKTIHPTNTEFIAEQFGELC